MDLPPRKLPPKKEVMIALLAESSVFVHLDPRRPGVQVPKWLQNQPELTLQLGLNMPIPIPDLDVEDDGISCTLSFSRTPFWCMLPWSAVFAIVSEKDRRGVVWPDDVPSESALAQGGQKAPPPKARPKLTALGPNDRLAPEEPTEPPPSQEAIDAAAREAEMILRGPPPADAKCASCATRWVEDQSSCPVCGGSDWISASESAAPRGFEITPESPPPAMRPTLVEDPNAKKRSAARPRAKGSRGGDGPSTSDERARAPRGRATTGRGAGPREVPPPEASNPSGGSASPGAGATSRKGQRPRPLLVPEPAVPTTLALFPPRLIAEEGGASTQSTQGKLRAGERETADAPEPPRTEKPTTKVAADESPSSDATDPTREGSPDKKPSKRPLPPYLRVVK